MTTLLSMDTSTKATGCAVYKDGKLETTRLLSAEGKADERIKNMISQIMTTINAFEPDIVVVETPSLNRNPQTQRELCYVCGSVLGKCVEKDIYFHEYRPTEWRKQVKEDEALPRKRAELKQWAVDKIKGKYGMEVKDDIAEAILIGEAYIHEFS